MWLGPGCLDSNAGRRKIEVIEAGVCSVVFLHLVDELSQELEGDWGLDVFRVEVSEICILLVERRFHFKG